MSKKGSLSAALQEVSGRGRSVETKPPPEAPRERPSALRTPGRQGKRAIAGFFDPAASKQLKKLALEKDSDVQKMMAEALNDLFEKYGLSRIA